MSEAGRNAAANSKAVLITNTETGGSVSYESKSAAARELGVSKTAVIKCIKSQKL
jgi:biotin operon repressor